MADSLSITFDDTAIRAALTSLGDFAQPYINEASRESAQSMVREAQGRLQRQLGPNATGQTVAGIQSMPARDGNGYVVVSSRGYMPMLPFWLERGFERGKPGSHTQAAKPFFYVAAELTRGEHRRRLSDALQQAIDDKGLGGT